MHEHHMRTLARDRVEQQRAEAANHLWVHQAKEAARHSADVQPMRVPRRGPTLFGLLRSALASMRRRLAAR